MTKRIDTAVKGDQVDARDVPATVGRRGYGWVRTYDGTRSLHLIRGERTFSLPEYRAFNDALEAKYPAVDAERTAKRIAALHREAREYLFRARRGEGAALQAAVATLLVVSEARGA